MNKGTAWREQNLTAGQSHPIPPNATDLLIDNVPDDPKENYEIRQGKVTREWIIKEAIPFCSLEKGKYFARLTDNPNINYRSYQMKRISLALVFLAMISMSNQMLSMKNAEAYVFGTLGWAIEDCNKNNIEEACLHLLNNDMGDIDPSSNSLKYTIGIRALQRGKTWIGENLLKRACSNKFEPACTYLKSQIEDTNTKIDSKAYSTSKKEDVADGTLEEGFRLYDQKDYESAFRIFEHYCTKYNLSNACFMLGICYSNGQGAIADPKKALSIFSSDDFKDDPYAKLQIAYIEEYDHGTDYSVRKAMNIYHALALNSNSSIQEKAKEGLLRLDIYDFLDKAFSPVKSYFQDKISYSQLEKALLNVNTTKIPLPLKNAYISWRLPFLMLAENKSSWGDTLWTIGKSAVKGFLLDFSFITDAAELAEKDEKLKPIATEEKHYFSLFIDQLQQ